MSKRNERLELISCVHFEGWLIECAIFLVHVEEFMTVVDNFWGSTGKFTAGALLSGRDG